MTGLINQPFAKLKPITKCAASYVKEIARLEQLNKALNEVDDIAGTYKKISEDQQELSQELYQALASAEAHLMDDHAPFFKAKIELIAGRIKEVEG